MRFPYVRYGNFDRPIVPVSFVVGDQILTYEALVDTGADISVIHADLAEALGIKSSQSVVTVAGLTGETTGFLTEAQLNIGKFQFSNVPVIFANDLGPQSYGILGHRGLFDRTKLMFEYAKREFSIVSDPAEPEDSGYIGS